MKPVAPKITVTPDILRTEAAQAASRLKPPECFIQISNLAVLKTLLPVSMELLTAYTRQ